MGYAPIAAIFCKGKLWNCGKVWTTHIFLQYPAWKSPDTGRPCHGVGPLGLALRSNWGLQVDCSMNYHRKNRITIKYGINMYKTPINY